MRRIDCCGAMKKMAICLFAAVAEHPAVGMMIWWSTGLVTRVRLPLKEDDDGLQLQLKCFEKLLFWPEKWELEAFLCPGEDGAAEHKLLADNA